MKVFELAKELEVGAIELVEKLKASGLNIRNHMVKLSPEEEEKARGLFAAPEVAPAKKKKVVKKKVVKKKVIKKKVVRKAAASTEKASDSETEEGKETKKKTTKKKVVTVKRKTVRKKAVASSADDKPLSEDKKEEEKISTDDSQQGLQVVFDPSEKEKVAAKAEEGEKLEKPEEKEKDLFKERMHTFTPVYIPPQEKADQDSGEGDSFTGETSEEKDEKSKKRIGNLASLVSKKGAAGKSQDITMLRANEEMKLATSLVGQAVYIPARRKKVYTGATKSTKITEVKDSKRVINLHGGGSARDIAQKLSQRFSHFADELLKLNLLVNEDDFIGMGLAEKIADLYNYRVEDKAFNEDEIFKKKKLKGKDDLPLRSPIITVMGHVDHGKTTLLDHIRKEKVVSGESGGITQHIGAYSVKVGNGNITFLDTPGHAAFAAMRQRGADLTDIVVLIVAADDGVMPQTVESIKYIKKAEVPVIVAVNKMDKEGASSDRIKQKLVEYEITPEEWGGDTQFVEISALKGDGIDNLLEAIHLQAEMMELRETPKGKAEGIVIESRVETGRGPVATLLVKRGTLHRGDALVVGEACGRVRTLVDSAGNNIKSAGPSVPVQVLGLSEVVSPGDDLYVVKNEREAKKVVDNRIRERLELENAGEKKMSLEDFFADTTAEESKVLNLIVRSDVQGSYEAIKNALETLGNDEVKVKILGGGVGAITDNDVLLAASVNGYILGFNMRPVTSARRLSDERGVDIKNYSVIYELINDVKLALEGMLEPERIERFLGRAEVKETFHIPKVGVIAGSYVIDGKIERGCHIRLLREERIIFDGKMSSLKRFKDDVKEVTTGYECGISLEGFNEIEKGDLFEAYAFEEKKRKLEVQGDTLL